MPFHPDNPREMRLAKPSQLYLNRVVWLTRRRAKPIKGVITLAPIRHKAHETYRGTSPNKYVFEINGLKQFVEDWLGSPELGFMLFARERAAKASWILICETAL